MLLTKRMTINLINLIKPVILSLLLFFFNFFIVSKVPEDLDRAREKALGRLYQNWKVSSCNEVISSISVGRDPPGHKV